jgi:hypothetical protein
MTVKSHPAWNKKGQKRRKETQPLAGIGLAATDWLNRYSSFDQNWEVKFEAPATELTAQTSERKKLIFVFGSRVMSDF